MALKAGPRGPTLEARRCARTIPHGTDRARPTVDGVGTGSRLSLGEEQLLQNWRGQGESDCLIKTKHCDGP